MPDENPEAAEVSTVTFTTVDRISEESDIPLAEAFASDGISTVIVDCSGISDLRAETVTTLVRAAHRRRNGQPRMILRGASMYVRALFQECGLDRIFEIE